MSNDFYSGIYNPDVLSCLANLSNDEVFTPPEVANSMLDICFCPARRSAPSTAANLSRIKSTTGPIPTNSGPRKTGTGLRTTPMQHCPGW